jgi:hypothetical protein
VSYCIHGRMWSAGVQLKAGVSYYQGHHIHLCNRTFLLYEWNSFTRCMSIRPAHTPSFWICKSTQIEYNNSRNSCGLWFLLCCIRLLVMERHAVQIIPSSILLFFDDNRSKIFPCCCVDFLCCLNSEIHCDNACSGFASSPEMLKILTWA